MIESENNSYIFLKSIYLWGIISYNWIKCTEICIKKHFLVYDKLFTINRRLCCTIDSIQVLPQDDENQKYFSFLAFL